MINYQANRWKSAYWRKQTRYYNCELKQNLFGEWVIIRSWGDIRSNKGRQMEQYCDNFEGADKLFQQVTKRRQYRKYQLVDKY